MKLPNPPKLVSFMLRHILNGLVIGAVFVLVLIWTNFMGIGTMLKTDDSGLATFLLFFQTSFTFGAVSMAIAVMHLGEDED